MIRKEIGGGVQEVPVHPLYTKNVASIGHWEIMLDPVLEDVDMEDEEDDFNEMQDDEDDEEDEDGGGGAAGAFRFQNSDSFFLSMFHAVNLNSDSFLNEKCFCEFLCRLRVATMEALAVNYLTPTLGFRNKMYISNGRIIYLGDPFSYFLCILIDLNLNGSRRCLLNGLLVSFGQIYP
ncbi:hypothetical protein ACJX0J_034352 [Zea mays]